VFSVKVVGCDEDVGAYGGPGMTGNKTTRDRE
jgi:hypothetical protein